MKKSEIRQLIREEIQRLDEASFVKGRGATGKIELERDQSPAGHGYSININGAWGGFWPDDPRDAAVVEMAMVDDGTEYGESPIVHNIEPKLLYMHVLRRLKAAGLRRVINAIRKAAKVQPNSPIRQSGGVRLRALVRPSLKGPVRFVEYDWGRFEFKL